MLNDHSLDEARSKIIFLASLTAYTWELILSFNLTLTVLTMAPHAESKNLCSELTLGGRTHQNCSIAPLHGWTGERKCNKGFLS